MILQEVAAVREAMNAHLEPVMAKMMGGFLDRVAEELSRLTRAANGAKYKLEEARAEVELLKGQVRTVPRKHRKAARRKHTIEAWRGDLPKVNSVCTDDGYIKFT